MKNTVCCVIPNWNGEDFVADCLRSLANQTIKSVVIVVDDYSTDSSPDIIARDFPEVELIKNVRNLGFAETVNVGIRQAIKEGCEYVALLNNDAVAHPGWLEEMLRFMNQNRDYGIVTPKLLDRDGTHFDGTGEVYTIWGIHYPRGRGEKNSDKYDQQTTVFGASGGASLYRVAMLRQIGLFDKDFFMYLEDIDLSFRAQLYGWKVGFEPKAEVYHRISASGSRIKGLTTTQTLKNLPLIVIKNAPLRLALRIWPRLWLVSAMFFLAAVRRKQGRFALEGIFLSLWFTPKKLLQHRSIQKRRVVSVDYLKSIIEYDLPPEATRLRLLRAIFTNSSAKEPPHENRD